MNLRGLNTDTFRYVHTMMEVHQPYAKRSRGDAAEGLSMSRETKNELLPLSFWAVGRFPDTAEVAIRLNSSSPIRMSVENAREIAAALNSEADALDTRHPRRGPVPRPARATKVRK